MSSIAYAEKSSQDEVLFISSDVTATTNIHNNEYYCTECHENKPGKGGDISLRYSDYSVTCRCHGYKPGKYRHPVGVEPSWSMKRRIPDDFPLEDGKITCNTCHAVAMQCDPEQRVPGQNAHFLRVSSLTSRTALCYSCHNAGKYDRLNPHEQIDGEGNILRNKCRYCHKVKPDEKSATLKKQRAGEKGTVEFVAEFFTLCFRCHYKQTAAHLINANHLTREPPATILSNIKISERELGIILPLDDEGGLTCATCHNPHQRGIIPIDSPAAKGASEIKRLRVPKAGHRICRACHHNH